MMESSDAISVL
jgi:hypothetical protein